MKSSIVYFVSFALLALAVPLSKLDDSISASSFLEKREIQGVDIIYNTPTIKAESQVEKRGPAGSEEIRVEARHGLTPFTGGNNNNEVDPDEPDDNGDTEDSSGKQE